MKEQFKLLISKYMAPWMDGSSGTPWAFTTSQLMQFADDNLEGEKVVEADGKITVRMLSIEEVIECMYEMGFNRSSFVDPISGIKSQWEIEALSTLIL